MSIPEKTVNELMVKCGRHCCICRRFDPLHLQINHIVEQADGGSDDIDNLIVVCLTCHSDIHTHTKLTRRFTAAELKAHRDTVAGMVASGKLKPGDAKEDDSALLINAFLQTLPAENIHSDTDLDLPPHALKMLLDAVRNEHNKGHLWDMSDVLDNGDSIEDIRKASEFKDGLEHLQNNGLITWVGGILYRVSYQGFLLADKLIALADTTEE